MAHRTAFAILLVASTALAAPPASKLADARQHYDSGLAHFNLQEYKGAIEEFEAAYRLIPDPSFLYNLAQAYRLDDNPERALHFYRTYLRSSPNTPNRHEIEGRIANLEKLVADKKSVAVPPDHALAPSDSKTLPARQEPAPPAPAAPVASPEPVPVATPIASRPERAETRSLPIYKRWWLWTIVGVVAAGAAVGIAVGVTAQKSATFNAGLGTVGPAALGVGF